MAITIKHSKVSAVADGPDTGLVRPSDWNADHTFTGTLDVANGGTGQTTQQAAINALAGAVTAAQFLRGNGTNVVMSAIQAADVPTLNQNTTGSSASCTGNAATATTLQTARNINGVSFNGSADITVADGTKLPLAGGTMTGTITHSDVGAVQTVTDRWAYSGQTVWQMGREADRTFSIWYYTDASVYGGRFAFNRDGSFVAPGNVTAYSDERLKADWADLPADFIEKLAEVKHGTYTRTDSGIRQIGVSAQSLQPVAPEAVLEGEHLSVAYGNVALAACVELAKEVVALRAEIEQLKKGQ